MPGLVENLIQVATEMWRAVGREGYIKDNPVSLRMKVVPADMR